VNTTSDLIQHYRERHAFFMELARKDREAGNHRSHTYRMEGAAGQRRGLLSALGEKRQREADGFVYLNNGFDCVRLYRNGRLLTANEVRAELSNGGAA
jgi:hypothetical protein